MSVQQGVGNVACFRLLRAYQSYEKKTELGKNKIFFNSKDAGFSVRVDLPCGQCIGCRIDRARTWALRCMHEASLYDANCFITLTYDEDHIPIGGSLVKSDFQKFIKRLRKRFKGVTHVESEGKSRQPIRYFHVGEYGENLGRPHHHACIFNFDFEDKVLWQVKRGYNLYRSAWLEELWPFGFSLIGDVTPESAAYVARYCVKKITGDLAAEHYISVDKSTGELFYLEPEYITMSRRPGIGKGWFDKYAETDVYTKDFVTFDGKVYSVPPYYDKLFDIDHSEDFARIKKERRLRALEHESDNTDRRLNVRRIVAERNYEIYDRSFENGA